MNENTTFCPHCGGELNPGAKFCTNCGKKIADSQTQPRKKRWGWILVVLLVLSMIGMFAEKNAQKNDPETSGKLPTEDITPHVDLTEPSDTVLDKTPAASDTQTTAGSDNAEALATLESVFDDALADNFGDNYQLTVTETSTTINVWNDGCAGAAVRAAAGDATLLETWNTMVDSLTTMSQSFSAFPEAAGLDSSYYCCVNLLNDQNMDNVLVSIVDGVVIYDVVSSGN